LLILKGHQVLAVFISWFQVAPVIKHQVLAVFISWFQVAPVIKNKLRSEVE